MKKHAFTLSEVLITLGVIAVISTLTIPTLFSNFNNKSLVVALERTYTGINDAVELMMMSERAKDIPRSILYISSNSDTVTSTAGEFLTQYFRVAKNCGTAPDDCFAASYANLNGGNVNLPANNTAYCVEISTGASICIVPPRSGGTAGKVFVDVNGPNKPNIAGRDLFVFYIYMDGFVGDRSTVHADDSAFCRSSYGAGCLSILMNSNWAMDY